QAEVDDVEALGHDAVGEGRGEADAAGAHVTADQHPLGAFGPFEDEPGERRADGPGGGLVELVGGGAADVVGLEDRVEIRHRRHPTCAPAPPSAWSAAGSS